MISTRLLSKQDKEDMQNGLISEETLVAHVLLWKKHRMPNYADGKTDPYVPE